MRDNHCMTMILDVHDASVMVRPPKKLTRDQSTTSKGLIKHNHKKIGTEVITAPASTETNQIQLKSQETSCTGLITYRDSMSGPNRSISYKDAATFTGPFSNRNVGINCSLPPQKNKLLIDKMTMTLSRDGRWISYSNMTDASCGDNAVSISSKAASTVTDTPSVQEQSTETTSTLLLNKSTHACIRPISSNASTNTSAILKYNRSTDCSEIKPVLRHNASNTVTVKTKTSSTQYAMNRSNLVDCMVNTNVVITRNAETTTDDLGNTKSIDAYVDKVSLTNLYAALTILGTFDSTLQLNWRTLRL